MILLPNKHIYNNIRDITKPSIPYFCAFKVFMFRAQAAPSAIGAMNEMNTIEAIKVSDRLKICTAILAL